MNKIKHKITITDVAREAGVSFGTVSRVINNDIHVKPETRQRVIETMDRLEFVVNRKARSLAGGKNNIIGVLVPDIGTGYIAEIINGIASELATTDYDLVILTTRRTVAKEAMYVANLAEDIVDGLLLVLPRNPADYTGALTQRKFPFVLIDHQSTGKDCCAVGATNWQGSYHAVNFFINSGHTRIGFITGSLDVDAAVERLEAYKAALQSHHIPIDNQLIYEGTFSQLDGYAAANYFLDLESPPTLIFASNDLMAIAAMDAVRERGLRIPEDISIMGFDDIPQAAITRPALTTIRQPLEQMGSVATQMLLERLNDTEHEPERIELPTELIIRDSTTNRNR